MAVHPDVDRLKACGGRGRLVGRVGRRRWNRGMAPIASGQTVHVTSTEGVCGGKPCVAGTRIRVQDIYVWHELQGRSPDQIVSAYPHLTLADVYAALAYFWDHRDHILRQMKQEEELVERAKAAHPSKLPDRAGGDGDAVSP
jgi:uncharacterized protein (DUF433 family)